MSSSIRRCPKCKITPLRTGNECTLCISKRIQENALNECLKQTQINYYQLNSYLNRIIKSIEKQKKIDEEIIQNGEKQMNYTIQKGKFIRNPIPSLNPGPKPLFIMPEDSKIMFCNESDLPVEEFIVPIPVICPVCKKSFDEKPGFRIDSHNNIVHNDCDIPSKQ